MNDEIEILKSIYSRSNEIIYNPLTEILIYNAFDEYLQTIAFSVIIYPNKSIQIDSKILTNEQLKQLQSQACLTTDLFGLFSQLKDLYEQLSIKRKIQSKKIEENSSSMLMKIDHMRSANVYMKYLKNWSDELEITGRVLVAPYEIFILIEGVNEKLKKFLVKLKTENVDINSRGRPCKERLLTQIVELNNYRAQFNNFEKIEFINRNELISYLTASHYEKLLDYINK